ncbi:MAG: DUF4838 domain-containing protein [Candidatus Woesearchaeota archaeon]
MINNINDVSNSYSNIQSELDALNKAIESKDINDSIKIYNSIRLHTNDLTLNAIERSEIRAKGLEAYKKIMQLKNNTEPNNSNKKNKLNNIIHDASKRNIAIGIIFVMLCGIMIVGVTSPTIIKNITSLFNNAEEIILPNQEIPGTINETNNTENNNNIINNISNQPNNNSNISNNNNQSNISIYINNSNTTYGSSGGGGGGSSGGNDEPDDPIIDTCTDGILNENETGIDCGGNCIACPKYLVENNTGYAEIIISQNAPNMVELAVADLQKYIYNMTGALLPINTIKNESIPYHIYVGQSNYTDNLGITDEGCEFDSFKMISGDDYLVLIGNDDLMDTPQPYTKRWSSETAIVREAWDNITNHTWESPYILYLKHYNPTFDIWEQDGRGTINAVSEFLYLQGVRWYHPGEIGEVVPIKDNILLPVVNKHVVPDFKMREIWMYSHSFIDEIHSTNYLKWRLRLRLNSADDSIGANRGHGINAITSRVGVNLAHPEYYAIWEGIRKDGSDGDYQKQDLCSVELLNENIAYVNAVFSHYDAAGEKVMPADGFIRVSESSQECIDKATPERGSGGELSDYVWEYVNNVATAVYETYPDKRIVCGAYTTYLLPPLNIDQLSPNVVTGIARWRSQFSNTTTKEFYRNLTYAWLEKLPSGTIYTGDYYLHNEPNRDYVGIPVYFPHIISDDLKFLNGKSLGEFIEASTTSTHLNLSYDANAANSLNIYITARLYWNSSEDIDDLLDEYYELYYGPASSEMKEFVEYSENNLNTMLTDPNVLLTLRAMGNNAKTIAGDTIYGERIDLLLHFMNATYIGEEASISSCQNLTSPSTKYKLTTDVESQGTCFNINTLNVTINCQGHKITYSTAGLENTRGVYSTYDHAKVINCTIVDGNTSSANPGRSGIYFNGINNGLIKNNTVNTTSNSAIMLLGSSNILLQSNKAYSNSSIGIYCESSTDLDLENNEGTSNSNYGMYMYNSDNSILYNNTGTSTSSIGIIVSSSSNVTLIRNTGNSSSSSGIYLYNALYTNLISNNGTSTINGIGINVYGNSSDSVLTDNIGRSTTGVGISIYVSSANITLIGNTGITNSSRGIIVESSNNILTDNIGISNTNNGIYIQNSYNTLINNNGTSNISVGIYINNAYNNLTNNIGTSNTNTGLEVHNSNNILNSNKGISNASSGIYLSGCTNNLLINNTGTSNYSNGMYIYNSNNNTLINHTSIGYLSTSQGIHILISNNTLINNCINISGILNDINIVSTTSSVNTTIINCSYNNSKESNSGATNNLIKQWYYEANITNNMGTPIINANVSLYNSSGIIIHSALTDINGRINKIAITEYTNTGGIRRYSTPHIVNVTKTGYTTVTKTYNITEDHNIRDNVILV